ncbi:hypothetical protein GHT06_013460 [Daphnia sinensis]|uniref:Uncharacterized protein n=1 Tax=Daphnia sinensis TaxID=1820382 RepID=A0AAD5PVC4_9CRUS|nr:hypothetical protein GHT06_013460 [Daphnia sinensis]
MDMAELKAIVQDITNQAGAPKHSDTLRGGDLSIFPINHSQDAFLKITKAANRSLSASLPKSSNGKKDSYAVSLSQKQTKICSTHSFSKVQQKLNDSTRSTTDPKNQPEQFASRLTGHYPTESPSSPSASQS